MCPSVACLSREDLRDWDNEYRRSVRSPPGRLGLCRKPGVTSARALDSGGTHGVLRSPCAPASTSRLRIHWNDARLRCGAHVAVAFFAPTIRSFLCATLLRLSG